MNDFDTTSALGASGGASGDGVPSGTPFARGLNIMLGFFMGLAIVISIIIALFGIAMFFSTGLQDIIYSEIQGGENVPSPQKFGFMFLSTALITAAYGYVLFILRKIVKTLLAGDPFVPENISRLRLVWIVLAVFELFRMVIHMVLSVDINALNVISVDNPTLDIRLGTWFLVFVIAALAEVFRHGAVMRRDQELTV